MMDIAIKDIKAGLKNLNVVFIVLEVGHPIITKEHREIRSCKVADSTASINVSIWDEPGQYVSPGDILKVSRGYAAVFRDSLTLYIGKNGDIQKIGEFCMVFNEQLDMSAPSAALNSAPQYLNASTNNVLVNSNGPPVNVPNNGSRNSNSTSVPPTTSTGKPLPLKNIGSSAMYNNSEGGNGKNQNQPGRSNARGRGAGPRR